MYLISRITSCIGRGLVLAMTCFILKTNIIYAQQPVIRWNNCHPTPVTNGWTTQDWLGGFDFTSDGGYIVTGYSGITSKQTDLPGHHHGAVSNTVGSDAYVVKVDANNHTEWSKFYGGTAFGGNASPDNLDNLTVIKQLPDGGYLLAGYTNSTDGDVTGYRGVAGYDAWVVRMDAAGVIVWSKTYGGTASDVLSRILLKNDGTFILAGNTASADGDLAGVTTKGAADSWFIHLSATGEILNTKVFGGTGAETVTSLLATPDGGYVFVTNTTSNDGDVSGNHGSTDYWLVKLDGQLNLAWQKTFGGNVIDIPRSVALTPDGGYIINGSSASKDGGQVSNPKGGTGNDFWVVKTDASGNLEWEKSLGGIKIDDGYGILATPDGGYLASGQTTSLDGDVTGLHGTQTDLWIVKLNATGSVEWNRCIGGPGNDIYGTLYQAPDGEFVIVPRSSNLGGDDNTCHDTELYDEDYWVVKFSACPAYTSLTETICAGKSYVFNETTLTEAGVYKETLQTKGGCDSIVTLTLNVTPANTNKLAVSICTGESYELLGSTYTNPGTYYKTTTTVSGCDSIIELSLTVNPLPVPVITASGTQLTTTSQFTTYEWFLEGSSITDANTGTLTAVADGDYTVKVKDVNSCIATSAVYNYKAVTTSLHDDSFSNTINVYPNPVTDVFTIAFEANTPFVLSLSSIEGKELLNGSFTENETSISLTNFPAGIYILKIIADDEVKEVRKIVKL